MQLVSQRSVSFHRHADSTDAAAADDGDAEEEAESEAAVEDEEVPVNPQSRSHVVGRVRTLVNECLAREEFSDEVPGQELRTMELCNLVHEVVTSLDARFRRANSHSHSQMAPTFGAYVVEFETLIGIR